MGLTERRDLRGGRTSWRAADIPVVQSDPLPEARVEVAIIGAGIMGASVAERLSAQGRRVAVLDRRPPAHGSTAASTALVMWGIDVPLAHLSLRLGFEEAARRWKRVFSAVNDLAARIDDLGLDCDRIERSLAGEWIRWERDQLCCPGGGDHRLGHRWEGRPVREVLRSLSLRDSSAVSLTPLPGCRHRAYPPSSTWRV